MKLDKNALQLLNLSRSELTVLSALIEGFTTPVTISNNCRITRPTVYDTLKVLKTRKLVKSHIESGKKFWTMAPERVIEEALYAAKKQLLGMADNVEEVHGLSDASIVLHRGSEAITKLLFEMVKHHASERLYVLSGNDITDGWDKYVGAEKINEFNRAVKKQGIISEMIISEQFITNQLQEFGPAWGTDFEGRTAVVHEIDPRYLAAAGQIFVFKKSLYLMALNEAIIVEVRNSEIQKMILSLFKFTQDHADKFDINAKVRSLLEQAGEKKPTGKLRSKATPPLSAQNTHSRFTGTVLVHRGAHQVRELLFDMFSQANNNTFYGLQGNVASIGWDSIFSAEQTVEINKLIKKNNITVEVILPTGWVTKQFKLYGKTWAQSFVGRTTQQSSEIDETYFNHGGQIFLFNDSIYLLSLNEALVIEIRNSDMQTLLRSQFHFVQDNARKFNINQRIEKLLV